MNHGEQSRRRGIGGAARYARMRRCLKLRQGINPLRSPAPFPCGPDYAARRESVKGSQAAHKTRALDSFPPFGNAY